MGSPVGTRRAGRLPQAQLGGQSLRQGRREKHLKRDLISVCWGGSHKERSRAQGLVRQGEAGAARLRTSDSGPVPGPRALGLLSWKPGRTHQMEFGAAPEGLEETQKGLACPHPACLLIRCPSRTCPGGGKGQRSLPTPGGNPRGGCRNGLQESDTVPWAACVCSR